MITDQLNNTDISLVSFPLLADVRQENAPGKIILLSSNGGHAHSAILTVEQAELLAEGEAVNVAVLSTLDAGHTHLVTVTWNGSAFEGVIASNHSHTFVVL